MKKEKFAETDENLNWMNCVSTKILKTLVHSFRRFDKAVCEWSDKVLHLSMHFNPEIEAEDIK